MILELAVCSLSSTFASSGPCFFLSSRFFFFTCLASSFLFLLLRCGAFLCAVFDFVRTFGLAPVWLFSLVQLFDEGKVSALWEAPKFLRFSPLGPKLAVILSPKTEDSKSFISLLLPGVLSFRNSLSQGNMSMCVDKSFPLVPEVSVWSPAKPRPFTMKSGKERSKN